MMGQQSVQQEVISRSQLEGYVPADHFLRQLDTVLPFDTCPDPSLITLWNRQASQNHRVSAELQGIAAGRAGLPVRGTGILVGGTLGGGGMIVSLLETGEVHSDGGIAPGTPDRISGGVFILQGTDVDVVRNFGAVTTYGANHMVLDKLGTRGAVARAWQGDLLRSQRHWLR